MRGSRNYLLFVLLSVMLVSIVVLAGCSEKKELNEGAQEATSCNSSHRITSY